MRTGRPRSSEEADPSLALAALWRSSGGEASIVGVDRDRRSAHLAVSGAAEALRVRLEGKLKALFDTTHVELKSAMASLARERTVTAQAAALAKGDEVAGVQLSAEDLGSELARLDGAVRRLLAEEPRAYLGRKLKFQDNKVLLGTQPRGSLERVVVLATSAVLLSLLGAWAVNRNDTRFRSTHETHRRLRLPVLGTIPRSVDREEGPPGSCAREPAFVGLAGAVERAVEERDLRSLLISSALPSEGKTTVAVGLAAALANRGLQVVLIEGNPEHPTLQNVLHLASGPGLAELMNRFSSTGSCPTPEAGRFSDAEILACAVSTETQGLRVVAGGDFSARAGTELRIECLRPLILRFARIADLVICDSGALCSGGSARSLANCTDGALLVLEAHRTEAPDFARARMLLGEAQASLVGVVLNKFRGKLNAPSRLGFPVPTGTRFT